MLIPPDYQHLLALSPREWVVLCQVANFYTPKEIAEKLSLTAKAVNTYNKRIADKLGYSDSHEMIRFAVNNANLIAEVYKEHLMIQALKKPKG